MARHLTFLSGNRNDSHSKSAAQCSKRLRKVNKKLRLLHPRQLQHSQQSSITGTGDATATLISWNLDACRHVNRADTVWVCEGTRWRPSAGTNRRAGRPHPIVLGATYDQGRWDTLGGNCRVQNLLRPYQS